jgi:hydrogenase maturation protein HypF
LIGLRSTVSFEAQAAIELEALCAQSTDTSAYPFEILAGEPLQISTVPLFDALLTDLRKHCASAVISRRFHLGLARALADAAASIAQAAGNPPICLTGGCFQNIFLAHALEKELRQRGLRVYTHCLVPPGDGGLSLGQAWIAAQEIASKTEGNP